MKIILSLFPLLMYHCIVAESYFTHSLHKSWDKTTKLTKTNIMLPVAIGALTINFLGHTLLRKAISTTDYFLPKPIIQLLLGYTTARYYGGVFLSIVAGIAGLSAHESYGTPVRTIKYYRKSKNPALLYSWHDCIISLIAGCKHSMFQFFNIEEDLTEILQYDTVPSFR